MNNTYELVALLESRTAMKVVGFWQRTIYSAFYEEVFPNPWYYH